MKRNRLKIVLTGGHAATPGIAVIEELKKQKLDKDFEIYWVGSRIALSGTSQETIEYKILPKIGVKFYPITAGKLQTKFTRYTIPLLLKIPLGFFDALRVLFKIRPDVVLSFGGFASFPVVFWSWIFRVPIVLHEQTVAAGRASITSAFFAAKIALARSESKKYFPAGKSIITGNPVMSEILDVGIKSVPESPMTILVMGGSRGSHFINEKIFEIAPILLKNFNLIHITGEYEFDDLEKRRAQLPRNLRDHYELLPSVNPFDMAGKYKECDMVIGRSGANTVSELIIVKRPSILIPLPDTFMNEQVKNAKYAEEYGVAKVIEEDEATSGRLLNVIENVSANWQKIISGLKEKKSPDLNAARDLTDILFQFLP